MPIDNIVDFILYVVPGFIATGIWYSHYPVKERSPLTQLAQTVLAGLIAITGVRWLDGEILNGVLHSSTSGPPDPLFTASILLTGVLLGYIAVWQVAIRSYLSKRVPFLSSLSSPPDSIWQYVNQPTVEDWAVVRLRDGAIYLGWISRYRFNPDAPDQDFLLTEARRVDDRLKVVYPVHGLGVYLNTRDVTSIEFVTSARHPRRQKKPRRSA